MSVHIQPDNSKGYLCIVVVDSLPTVEELESNMKDFLQSGRYAKDIDVLFDLTGVDFSAARSDLFREYITVREHHPERRNAKIALLVSSEVAFGLLRMYQILSEKQKQQIMVFHNREEAERWLQEGNRLFHL